jgi:DNA transformation protein
VKVNSFKKIKNIGGELEKKLIVAGVENFEQLKAMGAEKAFMNIQAHYPDACISMLCALEGAVREVRWHDLPEERKTELKVFYSSLKKISHT